MNRALILSMLACSSALAQMPPDVEIRKILAERVGPENLGSTIVVGVIDAQGRRVVAYGSLAKNDARKPGGDTVFEIGSMSKVFTSLLLMDMSRKGELVVSDPVAKFLPETVKVPERGGRKITLADLSTQSSGLPRMPTNFTPKDAGNPYADYSVQQMYDFISGYQLTRDIGSQYEYSNLGVGLLGHALARRAGMSWEELVRKRICDPLGMSNTRVTLTPEMKARLAVGHSAGLAAVPNWDIPTLAGAGALRSTANDMLIFLAANLGYAKTPLAQAMADEIAIRRPVGGDMEIAYGWHVQNKDGNSIIWHNGGTGGYRTYMGFDPKARTGVVVLSNVSTPAGPDDIGRHLLNASYPLTKVDAPVEHKEITLDAKALDRYVGTYQMDRYVLMSMSRDGQRMYTELTGQPKFEVFPESERKFFLKVVDAQLIFDEDAQRVTLHQNGNDIAARRLTEVEAKRAADAIEAHKADIASRFKEQKQSPGTEAAVRRSVTELQTGAAKYELMTDAFAAAARKSWPPLKAVMAQFGGLQSVKFTGVGPGGADIYEVQFEKAKTEWRIMLDEDGKTALLNFRPL
uniref:Beta-lactamase n=1 Tax=Solibacter usitatus (strain Ellin6076) TaxID=234267 RepID=Q01QS0_SOLUE